MGKYNQVIDILTDAKEQISKLLDKPEDENHKIRLTHRLQVDIDHVNLLHSVGVDTPAPVTLGPATTIGGKKIEYKQKVTEEDVKPSTEAVMTLKRFVEEAYAVFIKTPNDDILKMDDTVVRGVAKKAGLNKVTKDNPEKITTKFIDEVKELIAKKSQ